MSSEINGVSEELRETKVSLDEERRLHEAGKIELETLQLALQQRSDESKEANQRKNSLETSVQEKESLISKFQETLCSNAKVIEEGVLSCFLLLKK